MNFLLCLFTGNLLKLAREKVVSDGYLFAKGKSRARGSCESESQDAPKRKKTDINEREREITLLQENLSTLESRLKFKQQMLDKARSVSNFKQCDEISGDIITVRREKRVTESQLEALQKKQVKSQWYHDKKQKRKDKKGEAKGSNKNQHRQSTSSILEHFTNTSNDESDERKAGNESGEHKGSPSILDVSSSDSDDTLILTPESTGNAENSAVGENLNFQ